MAFWPKHDLRSNLKVPNLKIFLGEHAPSPPYFVNTYALRVHHHNGCTNLK